MKKSILLIVLFVFACISGKSQASEENEDVIWRKEVSTPEEVKFSPDDNHLASLNRSKTNLLILETETSEIIFDKTAKEIIDFAFLDNERILMLYPDTLKTFNFLTNELEKITILPYYSPGFEFNRETNEAIIWSLWAANWKERSTLEYVYYDFNDNQFSEIFNFNHFITGDSLVYSYTFDIYYHFIKCIYNNNLLVSISVILDDGTPFESRTNYIGVFDGETRELLYKKEIELTDDCQNDVSNDGRFLANGNTIDKNICIDLLSLEDSLRLLKQFPGQIGNYPLVNYTYDNNYLVTVIGEGLSIWDVNDNETPVYIYDIQNPTYDYGKIDISHNNNFMAIFNKHMIVLIKGHFYPSGVEENTSESNIKITPNPADDKIKVDLQNITATDIKLKITDILGNSLLKKNISLKSGNLNYEINTSGYAPGTYYLHAVTKKGNYTQKFVIER